MLTPAIQKRLTSVILGEFSPKAKHYFIGKDGHFILRVYWKFKDERTGKQKLSKDIHIHITETGIEDYAGESPSGKLKTEKQLAAYIRKKLLHFDPSHNTPLGAPRPHEKWSFGNA